MKEYLCFWKNIADCPVSILLRGIYIYIYTVKLG